MNNTKILFLFLFFSFSISTFAQIRSTSIQKETNVAVLDSLAEVWREQAIADKEEAIIRAQQLNIPIRQIGSEGEIMELMRFDENDLPVYYITHNTNAAISTRADRVHSGGGAGLNLEGSGMTIGEWDGGATLLTHEQLSGRVNQVDGATSISDHATHVAGTLIGDGTGTGTNAASAKGMAPLANLDAHDWNSDNSEMATAAAAGLLISNHSYGYISGYRYDGNSGGVNQWTWWGGSSQFTATGEEPSFGRYDNLSQSWDVIAINAPYYLIVKSAGNERNDNPGTGAEVRDGSGGTYVTYDPALHPGGDGTVNGGFDNVGSAGNAKNVLTVAATNDVLNYTGPGSVSISSFSSWGPTDDGRIKPDISGNGVGLWSSLGGSDSSYGSYSGTSMSTPNVAGSAILLQEHYEDTHGTDVFMRAATLKGLIIHTADEAGANPGPDYTFGWGLMNTELAANVITEDVADPTVITENILSDGGTYTTTFTVDGTEPLIATISWTDPEASVGANTVDDPALKLVNDLDLRLDLGGTIFNPYILDPANPNSAATTGDNFRDNVEKIYIDVPTAGTYTLTVNHKGTLTGGSQDFSLIITGTAPNGCFREVTNTNDNGPGSLRAAIDCVNNNPGPDLISFNIPGAGPHVISPLSPLPFINDESTVVDATTQPSWTLGSIVLDGTNAGSAFGIVSVADSFEIYGMKVQNFSNSGIGFISDNAIVGEVGKGNVCINNANGLLIQQSDGVSVYANNFGVLEDGITSAGNTINGIWTIGSKNVVIGKSDARNIISGNAQDGINMGLANYEGDSTYQIYYNYIGTNAAGDDLGNGRHGVTQNEATSTSYDMDIYYNVFAYNSAFGVALYEPTSSYWDPYNNNFYCNASGDIDYIADANLSLLPPTILSATTTTISGTCDPSAFIELRYYDTTCPSMPCQANNLLGYVTSDANGDWSFTGTYPSGSFVTATQSNNNTGNWNTSTYSACKLIEDCPTTLFLNTPYSSIHDFEASTDIVADNLIQNGADVTYDAGNSIEMNPGFEVELGALFYAFIDGCGNLLQGEEEEKSKNIEMPSTITPDYTKGKEIY